MILSFGWTSAALVTGNKTVTRRNWAPTHAKIFRRIYKEGELVDAWNSTPRNIGARPRKIATIRLTASPEPSTEYPETDYQAEGFEFLTSRAMRVDGQAPEVVWRAWKFNRPSLVVVRFEVVEVVEPCFYCGQGREAGHEHERAGPDDVTDWSGGERGEWGFHGYHPALLGSP